MKPNNTGPGLVAQENSGHNLSGIQRPIDSRLQAHAPNGLHLVRRMNGHVGPRIPATTLNRTEKRQRSECEDIIRQGWDTFLQVGRALAAIRDKRLYRDRHETFEAYCRQKWEFSKTHANRLIDAASVAAALTPIGVKLRSESHVRPLVGLAPLTIPAAWKRAEEIAGNGEVTAKAVRQAAEEFKTEIKPSAGIATVDKTASIPPGLKTAFKLLYEAEEAAREGDVIAVRETLGKLRQYLLEHARKSTDQHTEGTK